MMKSRWIFAAALGLVLGGMLLGNALRAVPAIAAYIPCTSSSALCFFELDKLNGTTIDTNSGTKSAGTQRIVIATDQPNLTTPLNVTASAGTNLNTSALAVETGGNLATLASAVASSKVNVNISSGTAAATQSTGNGTNTSAWLTESGCAGQTIANTSTTPFDNNGASTSIKLVSKVSAKKVYICGIKVGPVAGAINIAIVEGTKSSTECDTGAKGLFNGATAARGDQLAANSGFVWGNGVGVLAITPDANNDVCILFSGTAQTGGTITWAQF